MSGLVTGLGHQVLRSHVSDRVVRDTMTKDETAEGSGRHVKRKHGLTRSKDGCLTCRKRRKKCDGSAPTCGHCLRLGLTCGWPTVDATMNQDTKVRSRRTKSMGFARTESLSAGASTPDRPHTSQEFAFLSGSLERDFEVQQAAEALLTHRDTDLQAPSPLPVFDSSNGYQYQDITSTALLPMMPTPEDLEAAQWLSNYKTDMHVRQDEVDSFDRFNAQGLSLSHQPSFQTTENDSFDLGNLSKHQSFVNPASQYSSSPEEERRFFIEKSPFEDVDPDTRILLDYFETEFAQLISVAPRSNNNLLRVFLPMATHHAGVRDALSGWSATHLRDIDDKFKLQSHHYLKRAVDWLQQAIQDPGEQDKDTTLAVALIICAVEVCKDTDSRWLEFKQIAHDMIRRRNLVYSYGGRNQIFMLKNFAYHDVMSSSPPLQEALPNAETQIILNTIPNIDGPDCYMGICTPLYGLIAEITALAAKVRIEKWDQRRIATHASRMIVTIDNCEPTSNDLKELRSQERVKHSVIFKILQLTSKLYINQTLLRYNPSSIGSQILIQSVMPLFSSLQTVLVEMLFPLFIVGVDCLGDDRKKVGRMMEIMFERFRIGNTRCAFTVLEKCWESNLQGERFVDWNAIAHSLFGQCITLA